MIVLCQIRSLISACSVQSASALVYILLFNVQVTYLAQLHYTCSRIVVDIRFLLLYACSTIIHSIQFVLKIQYYEKHVHVDYAILK